MVLRCGFRAGRPAEGPLCGAPRPFPQPRRSRRRIPTRVSLQR
ncbi:hypothetical protein GZL_04579 [Streptomyces sp. 769]|nr:hypothetical protein GZL_04579 [Streptomyces sp. 769]